MWLGAPLGSAVALAYVARRNGLLRGPAETEEEIMPALFHRLATMLAALVVSTGLMVGLAQAKVTIAVGGASCLCYLPTMLAASLGEFKKAGVDVEVVQFKGGS
ncbi:MAG: hypothetical protein B7Y77_02375, partial [Bradyrhizobium sp. 35-63-5]